jgi:hypothetical protein
MTTRNVRGSVGGGLVMRRRDLHWLGIDADAIRLPSHFFAVLIGHGGAETCAFETIQKHFVDLRVGIELMPG